MWEILYIAYHKVAYTPFYLVTEVTIVLILIKALYLSEQMILESLLLIRITHPKGEHVYSKILHMMVKDGSSAFLTLFLLFSDGTLDSTCRSSILCLHIQ